jgi:hypothetical protein
VLVGAFAVSSVYTIVLFLLLAVSVWAIKQGSIKSKRIAMLLVSICFGLTCSDLLARLLPVSVLYRTPEEAFKRRWPTLPMLVRFPANVKYDETTFGDLAAISGNKAAREYRQIKFATDNFGFRNNSQLAMESPDLVMLGDSFGEGTGTTQEDTWCSFLSKEHALNVYNLSVENNGPWQEFTLLSIEADRLKLREGTVIVWAIFTGNDLDDPYFTELDNSHLPWNNTLGSLRESIRSFRIRSPINQMLARLSPGLTPSDVSAATFIDGRQMLFMSPYAIRNERTMDQVIHHKNFAMLKSIVSAMKKFVDGKRLKLEIVLVPSKDEVYSWVLHHAASWSSDPRPSGFALALRDVALKEQISFLDLKPSMIVESKRLFEQSGNTLWWFDDTHWNSFGHRFAASGLYDNFKQDLDFARDRTPSRGASSAASH